MADDLPGPDADCQAWATNSATEFTGGTPMPAMAALGLVAADMTPVTTGQSAFNRGSSARIAAEQATMAAKQTKDEARSDLTAAIRPPVRRLQASPQVRDAARRDAMQEFIRVCRRFERRSIHHEVASDPTERRYPS